MGLAAERASGAISQDPSALSISGHFLSIDEGNRTERVVIGLGAGRTDVESEIVLYQNGQRLEKLNASAKSAASPGMAETMGVGGLAGHLLVSAVVSTAVQSVSEASGSTVESDADRAASKIAKTIKPLFVRQGWIDED